MAKKTYVFSVIEIIEVGIMKNIKWKCVIVCICYIILRTISCYAQNTPWHWILTLRGDASRKSMDMPYSLYVDKATSRYYVVDTYNNRLLSFSKKGKFLHAFSANQKLKLPMAMIHDSNSILWIVERGKNALVKINLKTKAINVFHLKFHSMELFPDRMHEYNGIIYLLDKMTGNIYAFSKELKLLHCFKAPNSSLGFIDFKVMRGALWALAMEDQSIYRFNLNGDLIKVIHLSKKMEFPYSLAIGPTGMIYVADRHKNCIFVFDGSGEYRYSFLNLGQDRGKIYYPSEIDFDPWGRLCIVEEGNGRVEIFGR